MYSLSIHLEKVTISQHTISVRVIYLAKKDLETKCGVHIYYAKTKIETKKGKNN